jgi:hypothetical protein
MVKYTLNSRNLSKPHEVEFLTRPTSSFPAKIANRPSLKVEGVVDHYTFSGLVAKNQISGLGKEFSGLHSVNRMASRVVFGKEHPS